MANLLNDPALGQRSRDVLNSTIADVNTLKEATAGLGWAYYVDTQYTDSNRLLVPANTDVMLPNNGLGGVQSYEPAGVALYEPLTGKVTGRTGDSLLLTVILKVERQANNGEFDFEHWYDIGGSIGELFRRYNRIREGGSDRPVNFTTGVFTLGTWAANGASQYIRSNVDAEVWDIGILIQRTFAA